jgi:DNA repair protein RadD
MISFKDLVSKIPDGKKREYFGHLYVNSISEFYNNFEFNDVELDDLVERNIDFIILNDSFINDLKLFSLESLEDIFIELESEYIDNIEKIRSVLVNYYGIEFYQDESVEFSIANQAICSAPLHEFQERIRRKVINLLFNNQKRFLIHMPTGSGKTRTAAEILLDFVRFSSSKALFSEKIKILWIAQSSELCLQAFETVKFIFEKKSTVNIKLAHFYDNLDISPGLVDESAIIFCSIQKLLLHYNKEIWRKVKNETYLVIVDEAHRSVASKWVQALNYFVNDSSVYLLGLTATPGIGTGVDDSNYLLSHYYHGNKISITDEYYVELETPIQFLVQREFLAHIERVDIDSNIRIEDSGYIFADNEFSFKNRTLDDLTANASRNLSIINIIKENYDLGKKILVFTCGLVHNKILKSILLDYQIESGCIDANSKNRRFLIDRFKNGDLNILLNFGVLTTGFDAPKTDVCIIARPISSIVMYSQMVGRILRGPLNKGNKKNVLYTIKDNLGHGDYDNLFNSFNDFYN